LGLAGRRQLGGLLYLVAMGSLAEDKLDKPALIRRD
jgi:hypothetical protein